MSGSMDLRFSIIIGLGPLVPRELQERLPTTMVSLINGILTDRAFVNSFSTMSDPVRSVLGRIPVVYAKNGQSSPGK